MRLDKRNNLINTCRILYSKLNKNSLKSEIEYKNNIKRNIFS